MNYYKKLEKLQCLVLMEESDLFQLSCSSTAYKFCGGPTEFLTAGMTRRVYYKCLKHDPTFYRGRVKA